MKHPRTISNGARALARIKEQTGRDKDRAVLAILRRTLQERGGT
jgi:hypothetical protein